MNIVLIEKDPFEKDFLTEELTDAFPEHQFTCFGNLADFMLAVEDLPEIDLIISEIFLPLLGPPEKDDERMSKLAGRYPAIVMNWDCHDGAKRLLDYLRKTSRNIDVVIYSHTSKHRFDEKLGGYPNVTYLPKEHPLDNLIAPISVAHSRTW